MRNILHLTLSPEGFAFNPVTGDSFVVNEVGLLILEKLQSGGAPDDAVVALTETYQLPHDQAARDVLDFRDRLRSLGLL